MPGQYDARPTYGYLPNRSTRSHHCVNPQEVKMVWQMLVRHRTECGEAWSMKQFFDPLYSHLEWQEEIADNSDITYSKMVRQIQLCQTTFKDWYGSCCAMGVGVATTGIQQQQQHPFNGPFPGLPRWAGTRKVKPIWILLKQETVSGSGISWDIRKSAPHSRQITIPTPHHSVFLQAGCPSCRPTNSVKALKAQIIPENNQLNISIALASFCVYR